MSYFFYFKLCVNIFWPQLAPSSLTFLQFCSMILQRPRIIVGYAGLEPGTSTPEFWRATNEPHLLHELPLLHELQYI